jgi:hypothetical protein
MDCGCNSCSAKSPTPPRLRGHNAPRVPDASGFFL